MKEIIEAIILGIVQGLTEFLPVSSSGHLLLLQEIFGITENTLFTTIVLHLGTLLAVVIYYFKDLVGLLKPQSHKTIWHLFVATIPACIVGLFLDDFFSSLGTSKVLAITFSLTAIMLLGTEIFVKKQNAQKPIDTKTALICGLTQCIALTPGISRSGSTICGGLLSKANPTEVAKFSFFMSIPVILGSLILELFKVELISLNWLALGFGFMASFISGLLAIKIMMKIIGKCNFKWFSVYLFIISSLCIIQNFVIKIW